MTYIAIIGDLIKSRQSQNRANTQNIMHEAFVKLNDKYSDLIVSKFTITLGDEFQGLLKPQAEIFQVLDQIQRLIPHPIRFGIGYGDIVTAINPEISIGADGPAYWQARNAIEYIKENHWNGKGQRYFQGLKELEMSLNTILLLCDTLKSQWTDLQSETFDQMLAQGIYTYQFNQKDFAEELGISQSSLSKRLNSSNIKVYLKGMETASHLLEEYHAQSK